ncbi:MAG TPA: sporulation protein [bacterium]|nr:sporulation protein [bacterium]
MHIDNLVESVLAQIREIVKTETVIGEPIKAQDVVLIPVSRVSFGFGAFGGKTESRHGDGEGTGGGVMVDPVAFIVIREDHVRLITLREATTGVGKIIELIPQVVDKVKGMKERGVKEKKSGPSKKEEG